MNIEQNKQIAAEFYQRFNANDIPGVLATMANDATFWIAGKPGKAPVGTLSKDQAGQLFNRMVAQLKDGLRMTIKSAIAEGDKVALEVVSCGELKNGRVYSQAYHTLVEIRDGKIFSVREYLDTRHVDAVWFQSAATAQNKQLLEHAFAETAKGNGRPFLDALAEDVAWRIIGSTAWSKTYRGKQEVLTELLQPLNAQFANRNIIAAHRFVAEDDYVVVEARGQNVTKSGRQYQNTYCWVFRFLHGKVIELIEYADTALMESALDAQGLADKDMLN